MTAGSASSATAAVAARLGHLETSTTQISHEICTLSIRAAAATLTTLRVEVATSKRLLAAINSRIDAFYRGVEDAHADADADADTTAAAAAAVPAARPRTAAETLAATAAACEKDGNLREAAAYFTKARDAAATAAAAAAATPAVTVAAASGEAAGSGGGSGGGGAEEDDDEGIYAFEIERVRRALASIEARQARAAELDYAVLHRDAEGLSLHEFRSTLGYGAKAVVITGLGAELVCETVQCMQTCISLRLQHQSTHPPTNPPIHRSLPPLTYWVHCFVVSLNML